MTYQLDSPNSWNVRRRVVKRRLCHIRATRPGHSRSITVTHSPSTWSVAWAFAGCGATRSVLLSSRSRVRIALGAHAATSRSTALFVGRSAIITKPRGASVPVACPIGPRAGGRPHYHRRSLGLLLGHRIRSARPHGPGLRHPHPRRAGSRGRPGGAPARRKTAPLSEFM